MRCVGRKMEGSVQDKY